MHAHPSILSLEQLGRRTREWRREGRRVVLCHGTFDLLHMGHIRHLQRARREGDVLVVTLTGDRHVSKGPGRPVFHQDMRAEALAALACVDGVAVVEAANGVEAIRAIAPDVYAKGSDYQDASSDVTGGIARERQAVEAAGGRVLFTDEITFSSTRLLNQHFEVFAPETRRYLSELSARTSAEQVLEQLDGLRGLRVLVLGDAIIDEYHYTRPLGQTGKGNSLAVHFESAEQFAGGAVAVANHIGNFADDVTLATGIGGDPAHERFLRSRLEKTVQARFFVSETSSTLVKRRFVDPDLHKLFEVYLRQGPEQDSRVERDATAWLDTHAEQFDLIVVPDFGNGFITANMIDAVCRRGRYLAVNTQLNSGNRGYHAIHRYRHAHFVALNEPELRIAAHNRSDPIDEVAAQVGARVGAEALAVTRGSEGLLLFDRQSGERVHVPALSNQVVDRIGAGDAFLSLAGLCLGGGLAPAVAAFVGSAAAALDVQIVCNREPVDRVRLCKYVTTLLK
ncbi:MAG: PfkB family carbohydrate kinase [Proteobacteria bacterium]|nr:PfkB family carbohydrate kinase [Pseudomonadota bacterium]